MPGEASAPGEGLPCAGAREALPFHCGREGPCSARAQSPDVCRLVTVTVVTGRNRAFLFTLSSLLKV